MGLITAAFAAMIAVAILLAPVHEVEEVEAYFTTEPLAYERTFVRDVQVRRICFPWYCDRTEVQVGLRNTDTQDGRYLVNLIFDDGSNREARSDKVFILVGEEQSVTIRSPLKGISRFTINVVPPTKLVAHERIVTKKVNTFSKLSELRWLRSPK